MGSRTGFERSEVSDHPDGYPRHTRTVLITLIWKIMKIFQNITYLSTIAVCCLLFSTSCDYLNKKPDNLLTSEMLWDTRANAESYLYQIYGYAQTPADDYTVLGASDETSCSVQDVNVRKMISGNWNPQSGYWQEYWNGSYAAIRQSFVFEENIVKMPDEIISQELKDQYIAEV